MSRALLEHSKYHTCLEAERTMTAYYRRDGKAG
jgi:hypothetical protein